MRSSSPLSRLCVLVALSCTMALVVGCATPPGGGTSSYAVEADFDSGVPDIDIEVDASGIEGDRMSSYEQHGGSKVIGDAVRQELQEVGRRGPSEAFTLKISVTSFRLRSSSSGFWLGAMAGADNLAVTVAVVVDDAVEKTFQTNASTVIAGVVRPGSMNRFVRMANKLAERIVAGL